MTAPMPLEDFTADQARRLREIEAAQEAPESFDAVAVVRRMEALAQELATVACDHHATVAGDAYADAADRIIAVIEGTYA